jgi:hypothetical protein
MRIAEHKVEIISALVFLYFQTITKPIMTEFMHAFVARAAKSRYLHDVCGHSAFER